MSESLHWAHSESKLLAFISGVLSDDEKERRSRHLIECAHCRQLLSEELQRCEMTEATLPPSAAAMELEFSKLLEHRSRPPLRRRWRRATLGAAAIAAMLLIAFLLRPDEPAPLDPNELALLQRVDSELPESLLEPLWIPVSARSLSPERVLGEAEAPGELAGLVAELEAAEAHRPDRPELRLALGHAQLADRNPVAAELSYRPLLDHRELGIAARFGLAASLYAQDRLPEALATLEGIDADDPAAKAALYDRALISLALGDREAATALADEYERRYAEDDWAADLRLRLDRDR